MGSTPQLSARRWIRARAESRAVSSPLRSADPSALPASPRRVFALVGVATLFEGFDTQLASLVLPFLQREFALAPAELGSLLSRIGIGTMLAFALIQLADRVGRRPVFLASLAGYALFSLATAFARSAGEFAWLQLAGRCFLVSELALAYVILSEELPDSWRGRANGLLGGLAAFGAAIPAALLPLLESRGAGWRGLFAIGALPLLLLPLYARSLRETRRFAVSTNRAESAFSLASLRPLFARERRLRVAAMSGIWFALNFSAASVMYFYFQYALGERGLSSADTAWIAPASLPFGFAGYAAAGWFADRIGRRPTLSLYLALMSAVAVLCYQSDSRGVILACYAALQALSGGWAVSATLCAELFPTALRASATALTHNLIGRLGMVIAPLATGALADSLDSIGDAVTALALAPLLCLPALWIALPETRGASID
jgi:putative MFS transporter